ncbi:MAG: hypothetical protein NC489_31840 [Ruminococcus flavefaciens]|nr:hypothetical protein [Ruminococcus flavefaciens]
MAIGIVGVIFMVNQFQRQVQLQPRVDKVRVSSIDQVEGNPFDFTAYQAYMFSWMMDGHDKTSLYYFANTDPSGSMLHEAPNGYAFPNGLGFIGLTPAEMANGFIVIRNRAIIGSGEYAHGSVKDTIYIANNGSVDGASVNDGTVVSDYTGALGNRWILEYTDKHVDYDTEDYTDSSKTNIFETRRDYVWSLHPCNHG